ncbi:cell division protein [Niveomyces insectorum RCEF 264]|uniref:rRNA methyltransferase 2, mitochondrial n=1 Tax=Niveomyces insectorum RCEF 264 TaxID=1081102 RepID=A0A167M955_9HYPO|nr:cell division protein [Niveomyces insectorum RCEF 264]
MRRTSRRPCCPWAAAASPLLGQTRPQRPAGAALTRPRSLAQPATPIAVSGAYFFSTCPAAAAASNSRWKARQSKDRFARDAKVQGLKSRAAFKLLEMDAKYRLFKSGQTVVDLGYAPGSWSQVALERTKPAGRILGIDLIPAQPPRGVSTIQGNFLSPSVRTMVRDFLATSAPAAMAAKQRAKRDEQSASGASGEHEAGSDDVNPEADPSVLVSTPSPSPSPIAAQDKATDIAFDRPSYLEMERQSSTSPVSNPALSDEAASTRDSGRMVDVVLSDMSAPWPQTYGFWLNTLSNPYNRMMNTSGNTFRDHAGSMDLCNAALEFACDTLRTGGHFVCKFYQGGEDKALEKRLEKLFAKVHREKPESSRSESKEGYFVALRRKKDVSWQDLEDDVSS